MGRGNYIPTTKEEEAIYRTVKCPKCGADPGSLCKPVNQYKKNSTSGSLSYSHVDRRKVAATRSKKNEDKS